MYVYRGRGRNLSLVLRLEMQFQAARVKFSARLSLIMSAPGPYPCTESQELH
jgi:hypothetical protein